jgi:hypothetical protein
MTGYTSKRQAAQDKLDDEYDQLGKRYAKALARSMKQTLDDVCNRVDGYKDLTPLQQDFLRKTAIANVTAHWGGFNKQEKNT